MYHLSNLYMHVYTRRALNYHKEAHPTILTNHVAITIVF